MRDDQQFEGLQIARALAALSVAYFHSKTMLIGFPKDTAWPLPFIPTYGGQGVHFFFAISGFVICLNAGRNMNWRQFLIRRAFRIYPLWIAAISLWCLVNPSLKPDSIEYIVRSILLLPIHGSFPLLDVGWSLQHEIAFYIVAAALAPFFGTVGIAIFLITGWLAREHFDLPWWATEFTHYYPHFLAGILAYWMMEWLKRAGSLVPLFTGCLVFWYCARNNADQLLFDVAYMLWIIGFVNMRVTSTLGKLGIELGNASYSIYLLHPIVFHVVHANFPHELPPAWTQEIIRFGALSATCLCAVFSFRFFERPINRFAKRNNRIRLAANPEQPFGHRL